LLPPASYNRIIYFPNYFLALPISMYVKVDLGVTQGQYDDLMAGKKIFLARDQFKGDIPLPLTGSQAKKITTATRGINLNLSPRQIGMVMSGQGWFTDALKKIGKAGAKAIGKALVPVARKGVGKALDYAQSKTGKLGDFQSIGDAAVGVGRNLSQKLLDSIERRLGGAAFAQAVDAQHGAGFFKDYLLPTLGTAASVAIPLLTRGGALTQAQFQAALEAQEGAGFFSDYFLPAVKTATRIAVPLLTGRGVAVKKQTGFGWFKDYLLPGIETAAKIIRGRGWEPTAAKKNYYGRGIVLHRS
jgi:hypothetical protein